MNQIHPDTQFDIHRSYQNERLNHSLQEKPDSAPRSFNVSKLLIFVTFLVVGYSGYVVML